MLNGRLNLHTELLAILENPNVYYQPPEASKMKYPAIVYSRSDINNKFANNGVYKQSYLYQVTVIDADPDSSIVKRISSFKTAKFIRHFTANQLNHDVFTIVY